MADPIVHALACTATWVDVQVSAKFALVHGPEVTPDGCRPRAPFPGTSSGSGSPSTGEPFDRYGYPHLQSLGVPGAGQLAGELVAQGEVHQPAAEPCPLRLLHGRPALLAPVQREAAGGALATDPDRKSTRLNSSHPSISYAVFCLKKKKK